MYRIITLPVDMEWPTVVCRDGRIGDPFEGYFMSQNKDDIEEYSLLYDNTTDLLEEAYKIGNLWKLEEHGIQHQAANGKWYMYDWNNQQTNVAELIDMT